MKNKIDWKKPRTFGLLGTGNAKTIKGTKQGYLTGILYLAPHTQAGLGNVCSFASKGCAAACLYTAGRGKMSNVQKARINKTKRFFNDPKQFIEDLAKDIKTFVNYCEKRHIIPTIRLNGTSDLPFERLGCKLGIPLMDRFPKVQFYDYTKNPNRAKAYVRGEMPTNYHLTFSRSECNNEVALEILKLGGSVATVFNSSDFPSEYAGFEVVDGDDTDLRFLDKPNVWVGLKAKGDAKKDESGFVIQL